MRVPISWLKEFVALRLPTEAVAERLTMAGIEVEAIERDGPETVLTLGIMPNRGECLSILGVAREVAALGGGRLRAAAIRPPAGIPPLAGLLAVHVQDRAGCPRYAARVIDGVRVRPSPPAIQARLTAVGIRPINTIVDATNYVMWERGQPLHAFDWSRVRGGTICVRRAGAPMDFATLDGVTRRLAPDDLVICDQGGPIALAGIIGGAESEIREATARIILESAYFLPTQVRRTSKRLGLATESSRRFERGVDPAGVVDALHRVTALIAAWAGGTPTKDWIDRYPRPRLGRRIALAPQAVHAALGAECPPARMAKILSDLGCAVRKGATWTVTAPTWRSDLTRPIDCIEEIARCWGYDRIPSRLPAVRLAVPTRPPLEALRTTVRSWARAQGFSETIHYAFLPEQVLRRFGATGGIRITNPLGQEATVLAPTLLPGLMEAVSNNCRIGRTQGRLITLRKVFRPTDFPGASEAEHLAGVIFGTRKSMSWTSSEDMVDYFDMKGAVEALLASCGIVRHAVTVDSLPPYLHPGQAARCRVGNEALGVYGMVSPDIARQYDFPVPVGCFELDAEALARCTAPSPTPFRELPKFPGVRRDVAFVVDAAVPAESVAAALETRQAPWLASVTLFDVYEGEQMPAGKKSVAYACWYQDAERTLTDAEVNAVHAELVEQARRQIGAEIRS
ncbi:MAG: phenylalanine--tRNA ligase subunit beta [Deltaproteobacteria bacterium]|nr:phenylalanine--tRNA ligase subunit beta [Deltaproteobacteria bacterium]